MCFISGSAQQVSIKFVLRLQTKLCQINLILNLFFVWHILGLIICLYKHLILQTSGRWAGKWLMWKLSLKLIHLCVIYLYWNYVYFLLQDESEFVRRMFVEKLHERLMQWKQQKFGLPSAFISYFVLAGLEQDEDVKSSMLHALNLCVQDKRQQVWSLIYVTRG